MAFLLEIRENFREEEHLNSYSKRVSIQGRFVFCKVILELVSHKQWECIFHISLGWET